MLKKISFDLGKMKIAKTKAEREAIYRFRYRMMVVELNYQLANADHEKSMVYDTNDEEPQTLLLYTGSIHSISSTLRCECWEKGAIPANVAETYSLDLIPDIENKKIAELTMPVTKNSLWGKLIIISLMKQCYSLLVKQLKIDLVFAHCLPGFLQWYQTLGFHTYSGSLIQRRIGLMLPLILIPSDITYFKAQRSPFLPLAKRYFKKYTTVNDIFYQTLFMDSQFVTQLPEEILESVLQSHPKANHFLGAFSREVLELIVQHGIILTVPKERVIIKENVYARELFIIIEGTLEVSIQNQPIVLLTDGDIFGEIALFLEIGLRTATIKTISDAKLLMLNSNFIKILMQDNPSIAAEILYQFNKIMASRIVQTNQMLLSSMTWNH
jgi:CRP-like cAMP-binding protein